VEAYTSESIGYASRVLQQAVPGVRSCVFVGLEAQTLVVRFRKCRDIIGLVRIEKDIDIR
jgi:hypothetical protein